MFVNQPTAAMELEIIVTKKSDNWPNLLQRATLFAEHKMYALSVKSSFLLSIFHSYMANNDTVHLLCLCICMCNIYYTIIFLQIVSFINRSHSTLNSYLFSLTMFFFCFKNNVVVLFQKQYVFTSEPFTGMIFLFSVIYTAITSRSATFRYWSIFWIDVLFYLDYYALCQIKCYHTTTM